MSISLKNIQADGLTYSDSSESADELELPTIQTNPIPEPIRDEPEPEADDIVDEQTIMRSRLITKMYINEFPEKLKNYRRLLNKIDDMGNDELTNLRREFEIVIGMKTSLGGLTNSMMSGISMLEQVLSMWSPLIPNGLTPLCAQDSEFQDDLKLISLKYAEKINTRPEVRVGLTLAKNIMLLDRVNKSRIEAERSMSYIPPGAEQSDNIPVHDVDDLFNDL